MEEFAGTTPPMRRRIVLAPEGRRTWQGSAAQREWHASLTTQAGDRFASSSLIFVMPNLLGLRPLPAVLLKHFSARLAAIAGDKRSRKPPPHWLSPGSRGLSIAAFLRGRLAPSGTGDSSRIEDKSGSESVKDSELARLKALLATLRLSLTPVYCSQLAASLAVQIGLHPAYVWDEALLSSEMFLTLGWLGLLLDRGSAWMPAAVAEYFADVIGIDDVGHLYISEPLIADVMTGQDFRVAVADAAEARLRHDHAFLCWPIAEGRPIAGRGGIFQ